MRLSDRKQQGKTTAQFEAFSRVHLVRKGSPSLKSTVPEKIANLLDLKDGDLLKWEGDIEGGEVFVTVEKEAKGQE